MPGKGNFSSSPDWASPPPYSPVGRGISQTYTVLILGETGVGKSTLINALANYLSFDDLDQIDSNGVLSLIPTKFFLYDSESLEEIIIRSERLTLDDNHNAARRNEENTTGNSSTQHPRTYEFFPHLGNGDQVRCRIIDTPGMGDTRGIDQDKKNMDLIIKYIADYPEINGILMLLKPNNSRLTTWFRFCIKELLKSLHKDCVKNIIFMFTNARSTLYRPGDTMPALKKLLGEVKRDSGVDIPVNKSNLFMVDNEAYRYLLARGKVHFTEDEESDFHNSWKKSSETCRQMLDTIAGIESFETEKTVVLYEVRSQVLELCKPLADVAASIMASKKSLDDQIKALSSTEASVVDLQKALNVKVDIPIPEELPHPVTVCSHQDCVKHLKNESGVAITDYVTKCHEHCYLSNVPSEVIGDTALLSCWAMVKEICRVCSHSYRFHLHIWWKMTYEKRDALNDQARKQIESEHDNGRRIQMTIDKLEKKIRDLEKEERTIMAISAKFAVFVKSNGIVLYNDALLDYLDHLIKEARDSSSHVSSVGSQQKSKIDGLNKLKQIYESERKLLTEGIANYRQAPPSASEVKRLLRDLTQLEYSGKFFKNFRSAPLEHNRSRQSGPSSSASGRNAGTPSANGLFSSFSSWSPFTN
ncbi:uncharacterized protein BJ171DRAFT_618833 [Polychytrium aggregatum]|uniref:uncharacterized protein n=1 Tax=Polychytrium aggregatum TaxID=110093 RepID=UPI0022FEC5FE|nr:uncharacterized protein BJ171DRAFT_618833 [Polychytrium aggregatum]KAI9204708.1 hypothetical protein BJ171DRAFT_618833 [Polychytrium aggregatum]